MDKGSKNMLFSGNELSKLMNFCNECALEDKRIHQDQIKAEEKMNKPLTQNNQEKKPSYQSQPLNGNVKFGGAATVIQPGDAFASRLAMFSGGAKK